MSNVNQGRMFPDGRREEPGFGSPICNIRVPSQACNRMRIIRFSVHLVAQGFTAALRAGGEHGGERRRRATDHRQSTRELRENDQHALHTPKVAPQHRQE